MVNIANQDLGIGELSPGATPRRWEPEEGTKKLNERIHRESKYTDDHMNLPFKFSKPVGSKRQKTVQCTKCDTYYRVNITTVGLVCNTCHKYSSVKDVEE